jgi:hypothetical protein
MPEIKELIAAVKTLHSIAETIQNYDPSPEDLEDLFYLKPDLKESYDKIKNWIIPSSFDGNLVGDDVVTSEPVDTAIEKAVEETVDVEDEDETEESTDYSGEDETFLDLLLTLIVERYDGWRVLDAWTEIQNTYVKSGRLPYNKSYKAITKRNYTVNTDKFFELVGDKPGKREKDARIIHVIADKGPVPTTTIKLNENKIIGESFFDKPEFQKRISPMPKFIYMPIVVKLLQHNGNVSEIIDEAKDSVEKLMMIARVKSALIAVKKFTEYDDITIAILAANSIMKNGTRKPKKIQTELKNQYGVLLRDDTWKAIINKEFHPEITDVFFK